MGTGMPVPTFSCPQWSCPKIYKRQMTTYSRKNPNNIKYAIGYLWKTLPVPINLEKGKCSCATLFEILFKIVGWINTLYFKKYYIFCKKKKKLLLFLQISILLSFRWPSCDHVGIVVVCDIIIRYLETHFLLLRRRRRWCWTMWWCSANHFCYARGSPRSDWETECAMILDSNDFPPQTPQCENLRSGVV